MKATKYRLNDYSFGLYNIEPAGNFVVIEGTDPTIKLARQVLKIENPDIVTESFDKL